MCVSVNHISTKSRYHQNNEDSLFIGDNFIIVADGMGGESSGDIASGIAIDSISRYLAESLEVVPDIREVMFFAIMKADENISRYVDEHPESYGMGTTVLLMICRDDMLSVAWCGDSRCYTYNNKGELHTLTKDHSYVQELIDANTITVEESFTHPDNNLITRFVGGGKDTCRPEYVSCSIADVDTVILCSDGLSGYCMDNDIRKILSANTDPALLPTMLKNLAVDRGSDDDITIVTLNHETSRSSHKHTSILDWFRRR